ncbi:hypothetical protein niasHS_001563 [Heterodera schachtii]|uniref:Uncharacterized protein n=1 Tax=Heterodera schachtii TaxID=97005 RepID=A0ABD2KDT0_HETSC
MRQFAAAIINNRRLITSRSDHAQRPTNGVGERGQREGEREEGTDRLTDRRTDGRSAGVGLATGTAADWPTDRPAADLARILVLVLQRRRQQVSHQFSQHLGLPMNGPWRRISVSVRRSPRPGSHGTNGKKRQIPPK